MTRYVYALDRRDQNRLRTEQSSRPLPPLHKNNAIAGLVIPFAMCRTVSHFSGLRRERLGLKHRREKGVGFEPVNLTQEAAAHSYSGKTRAAMERKEYPFWGHATARPGQAMELVALSSNRTLPSDAETCPLLFLSDASISAGVPSFGPLKQMLQLTLLRLNSVLKSRCPLCYVKI